VTHEAQHTRGRYLNLPVFSMWRIRKYAEKQRTVMIIAVTSRIMSSISTSCKSAPDEIGDVENTHRTGYKHEHLKEPHKPVIWQRHPVAYLRKRQADGSKLFRNSIHASKGNRESGASQAAVKGGFFQRIEISPTARSRLFSRIQTRYNQA